uniref:Thyroglobulin type-1 domain-containing protein n=1 Tax=Macrostomum lignano TaxID=282301 RepID=A0A1I8HZR0_9PLAT
GGKRRGCAFDCADLDCATLDCATLNCATLDCATLDCAPRLRHLDCATLDPIATTTPTSVAPTTTTPPPPKKILPICWVRLHLGVEKMKCRVSDGLYEARQCNQTHCFCVVSDNGAVLPDPRPVPLAQGSSLACPIVETTNLSVTITYGADYMSVLPTMEDEVKMQRIVAKRFAYEGNLQAHHIRLVDLEPGSILVTVGMQKSPGDSTADLPASAFELKTMALKQTLLIDFNGVTLAPSARQSFNENFDSSIVEPPTAAPLFRGNSDSGAPLNVVGIVVGVLITVAVVAVAAVLITFALRRRAQSGSPALPHESGNYETMSNASHSTAGGGVAYDNFANKVYGPMEDDVYDNIAQPAIQRQLLLLEEGRLRLAEEAGLLAGRAGRRKAEKFLNLALGTLVAKIGGAGVFALLQPAALLINFISELFILLGAIDQKPGEAFA